MENIINKKCSIERNCAVNSIKQILLFIVGTLFIFLFTTVTKAEIWREILLIVGWVAIGETVYLKIVTNTDENGRSKVLEKLLQSGIIENGQK